MEGNSGDLEDKHRGPAGDATGLNVRCCEERAWIARSTGDRGQTGILRTGTWMAEA